MENIMTNGFCELNENEMMMVDGGIAALTVIAIIGIVSVIGGTGAGYVYGAHLNHQAQITNAKADAMAAGVYF